ncbi:MAG TPA: TolC family protein [Gemmatimonadaceae bacterium]|nr:TolC family protein [Gemmatimonadaceae bacterium]
MTRRVAVLTFVVALLSPELHAQEAPRPISLDEAVRLAQRNAPVAVQARGQLRSMDASVRGAYAAFLPDVNLNMSRSWEGGTRTIQAGRPVDDQSPWSSSAGASFNLQLFDGGARFFEVRRARADQEAAEANDINQRFQIALDVKQAYYDGLAARESEAAARAQLAQAEAQMRTATARMAAGAATKSDSLRTAIQIGNAQLALITAQNALRTAEATLTRLVATSFPVTPAEDTLSPQQIALDSASLERIALEGPAVRRAAAAWQAARASQKAARTSYFPTINMSYSRGSNGPDLGYGWNDPFRYSSNLRFSASFPLFNRLNREEQRVTADVQEENAEAAMRDARFAARQQLSQFLGALRTAEARIAIQSASVAAAEEDVRVQQQRYAVGASRLLDLLTSQTELNNARAALIQARYDYRIAKAQLEALVGRSL